MSRVARVSSCRPLTALRAGLALLAALPQPSGHALALRASHLVAPSRPFGPGSLCSRRCRSPLDTRLILSPPHGNSGRARSARGATAADWTRVSSCRPLTAIRAGLALLAALPQPTGHALTRTNKPTAPDPLAPRPSRFLRVPCPSRSRAVAGPSRTRVSFQRNVSALRSLWPGGHSPCQRS